MILWLTLEIKNHDSFIKQSKELAETLDSKFRNIIQILLNYKEEINH